MIDDAFNSRLVERMYDGVPGFSSGYGYGLQGVCDEELVSEFPRARQAKRYSLVSLEMNKAA
jgi:hypothetical protein